MSKNSDPGGSAHARAWALYQANNLKGAKRVYEKIGRKNRADEGAWLMLGIINGQLGSQAEAETCLKRVVDINPNNFDARVNLGLVLYQRGVPELSLQHYRVALDEMPGHVDVLFQMGNAYARLDLLADAEDNYRSVLGQNPVHLLALGNLANVLACQGRAQEALPLYRRLLEIEPRSAAQHSNFLLCMHYLNGIDPQQIFIEHKNWAAVHCYGLSRYDWSPKDVTTRGKLRIGYVTPDFREHSVAYFLKPLLDHYDRSCYEVFCYADLGLQDGTTRKLSSAVDCIRDTRGLTDAQVAESIKGDGIDVLVDLAGHTENNRLLVFARRAAPVQMTYLGYPDTTGLGSVDYRITDQWADPPGQTEQLHTEKLLRLDSGFLCFSPPVESPEVSRLPYDTNGYVTFGSFNVLTKITQEIMALWGKLLAGLPDARLLIKNRYLTDERVKDRIWSYYESVGIERERIDMLGRTSKSEHMASYAGVDIALDTYPYNGTTTTCDTMWMGVPVVTMAGTTHVSRVGVSLLSRVGLEELVARDEKQYMEIALALAADTGKQRTLRGELRQRMQQSRLGDAELFCRDVESLYSIAWSDWCKSGD